MQTLSISKRNTFSDCARKYYYNYELGYKPVKKSDALRFGSLFHKALNAWWGTAFRSLKLINAMIVIDNECIKDENALDIEIATQLIKGYTLKWIDEDIKTIAVEKEFKVPLYNPETASPSKTFELNGSIDVLIEKGFIEHKTTKENIAPDSTYWQQLAIDGQISNYYLGAKSLGYECDFCIYDVIRKPQLSPYKATPEDKKKYKKDGTLYASFREKDETIQEFGVRLYEDIENNLDKYFARKKIVRLENDLIEHMFDMWQIGRTIRDSQLLNRWPRNPRECLRYGKCPYWEVCTKTADIADTRLFHKEEK